MLLVHFSGDRYTHTVTNSNAPGTSVSIDMTSNAAAHLKVQEEKYNRSSTSNGPWVTTF